MSKPRKPSDPKTHEAVLAWPHCLTAWYEANKRDLPWRHTQDPYAILLSEIMLQQTRVETVIPYYLRFLETFPTMRDLAAADEQQVLKLWEGLGYYRRARNLLALAAIVTERHGGTLPSGLDALQELPGLGDYTTAAVASLAFGVPVPVVDGNVIRVFSRFWRLGEEATGPAMKRLLRERLTPAMAGLAPGIFNQAMMELGALVCLPTTPNCAWCPLAQDCEAHRKDDARAFPIKKEKPPLPHYTIAVGIVFRRNKVLIARRKSEQMLGGLWEFPGGKVEANETPALAVKREILEETGLDVTVGEPLITVRHAYSHFKITLTAFLCRAVKGRATARESAEVRWVDPNELSRYPFPTANRKVLEALTGC